MKFAKPSLLHSARYNITFSDNVIHAVMLPLLIFLL
nr:MAG TPA: hypothetical protein [Caudoviricetes sp.]